MVSFWERCGYSVKDDFTSKQCCFSIIDIILSVIYAVLSFVNLVQADPSLLLFSVNFIILARFTLTNMIHMQKIADSQIDKGKGVTNVVFIIKITVGLLLCIMSVSVLVWGRIAYGDFGTIKFVAIFVIITSLIENIWNIGERLYEAVPQPMFYRECR